MNVTLEDAYAEACRALGESVVRERLLSAEVQRLSADAAQRETGSANGVEPAVQPAESHL